MKSHGSPKLKIRKASKSNYKSLVHVSTESRKGVCLVAK